MASWKIYFDDKGGTGARKIPNWQKPGWHQAVKVPINARVLTHPTGSQRLKTALLLPPHATFQKGAPRLRTRFIMHQRLALQS